MSTSQELPRIRKPLYYVLTTGQQRAVPSATLGNSILGKPATASNYWEAKTKSEDATKAGKMKDATGRPVLGVINNEQEIVVVYGPAIGQPGGNRRNTRKGKKMRRNKTRRSRR